MRATWREGLPGAIQELLAQEFSWSAGHLTALVNGCVFAPTLLTFWFVNGVVDFSTAALLGAGGSAAGLRVRLLAYLFVVPAFVTARAGYYLVHPVHRQAVLAGSCPQSRLLSLDWFTVGILVTGLPTALQHIGLWLLAYALLAVGIFLLPQAVDNEQRATAIKAGAILGAAAVVGYGRLAPALGGAIPQPAVVFGPVATVVLSDETLARVMRATNSLAVGPAAVAAVSVALNRLLTHPAVTIIPVVRHTLPQRDPTATVVASATLGTVFYLLFRTVVTGRLVVFPW